MNIPSSAEPTANLLDDLWIINLEAASDMSILTQQRTGKGEACSCSEVNVTPACRAARASTAHTLIFA